MKILEEIFKSKFLYEYLRVFESKISNFLKLKISLETRHFTRCHSKLMLSVRACVRECVCVCARTCNPSTEN